MALFAFVAIVLLTRLLLLRTDATWLSAIGTASMVVLPLSLLMLASQALFFIVSLGLFGAILLDSSGFPLSYTGAVLWILGGVSAFLLTLSAFARYIAPPFNSHRHKSYLGFVLLVQESMRSFLNPLKKAEHVVQALPSSFSEVNAGEVPDNQTYALYEGARFSNTAGPGYTLLNHRNRVVSIVDLRPQARQHTLQVRTRDGIELETKLRVEFSIARPPTAHVTRLPYPFGEKAVRDLVYGDTVQREGQERSIHPYDQVLPQAVAFLTQEFASRSLDNLLQVNTPNAQPLEAVFKAVRKNLDGFVKKKGLQIRSLELAPLQLPQAVQDTRLAGWKKSWEDPVKNRGLGQSIKRISPDQARAQLQVVEDLLENLNTFADADADVAIRDDIIEQVREVITDAAAEGLLKSLIPDPK